MAKGPVRERSEIGEQELFCGFWYGAGEREPEILNLWTVLMMNNDDVQIIA